MQSQQLDYYLVGEEYNDTKERFNILCKKYGKAFNLSFENSNEIEKKAEISEEIFVEKIRRENLIQEKYQTALQEWQITHDDPEKSAMARR